MLSSLETAEKFSGVAVRRLLSLKQLLYRPEYERGVRSSGVALPAETRRGTGVMNPVPFPFEWWLLVLLLKLFVFLGLGLDPKINSFSLSNKLCSFFWSCNKGSVSNYMCRSSCGCNDKRKDINFYPAASLVFLPLCPSEFLLFQNGDQTNLHTQIQYSFTIWNKTTQPDSL